MTAPCQACGEDPDLRERCPVTELRHVPSGGAAYPDGITYHDVGLAYLAGASDERSRSAAELAALREENARLRAALDEVAAILLLLK